MKRKVKYKLLKAFGLEGYLQILQHKIEFNLTCPPDRVFTGKQRTSYAIKMQVHLIGSLIYFKHQIISEKQKSIRRSFKTLVVCCRCWFWHQQGNFVNRQESFFLILKVHVIAIIIIVILNTVSFISFSLTFPSI